jgi:hypothetical protein
VALFEWLVRGPWCGWVLHADGGEQAMTAHLFAVMEETELALIESGSDMTVQVELMISFKDAMDLAKRNAKVTGCKYSVIPLKTSEWHGVCGNCGKPWVPESKEEFCPEARGV